jgi:signal transduction histidine kinase
LKVIAEASRRLIDTLLTIDGPHRPSAAKPARAASARGVRLPRLADDIAWELERNRNLLAALDGPAICLSAEIASERLPVRATSEDLTRVLVNLVKNAAEAMPTGGAIRIRLREILAGPDETACVVLTVEDNGPGMPHKALRVIFQPGYTIRPTRVSDRVARPAGLRPCRMHRVINLKTIQNYQSRHAANTMLETPFSNTGHGLYSSSCATGAETAGPRCRC